MSKKKSSIITIPFALDVKTNEICCYKDVGGGQEVCCLYCNDLLVKCNGFNVRQYLRHKYEIREDSVCFEEDKKTSLSKTIPNMMVDKFIDALKSNDATIFIFNKSCTCCKKQVDFIRFESKDVVKCRQIKAYVYEIEFKTRTIAISINEELSTCDFNIQKNNLVEYFCTDSNHKTECYSFKSGFIQTYCDACHNPIQYYKALNCDNYASVNNACAKITLKYQHFVAKGWIASVREQLREYNMIFNPVLKTWMYDRYGEDFATVSRLFSKPVKFVQVCPKCNIREGYNYVHSQLCKCNKN
jgi:hypothetical protein